VGELESLTNWSVCWSREVGHRHALAFLGGEILLGSIMWLENYPAVVFDGLLLREGVDLRGRHSGRSGKFC
jgi:hypothetical protein